MDAHLGRILLYLPSKEGRYTHFSYVAIEYGRKAFDYLRSKAF